MAAQLLAIRAFLEAADSLPVLDVRSPGEYLHTHIPGAQAFPLFSDAERKIIGTTYKQVSREAAVKIGLDYFGPKMRGMVEQAEALCKAARSGRKLLLHCWRGGLRSSAVAWLLAFYGFEVGWLDGGYKAYRHWVIDHWTAGGAFHVLSGNTGSGKTAVLQALAKSGAPVLDLEALAAHKGSAFGGLDKHPQPTQEMFENSLATALARLRQRQPGVPIWVEDESQRIGDVNLPIELFRYLQTQPKTVLDVPFEARLASVVAEYGRHATEHLLNAIVRIKKRLGPLETKTAVAHLIEGDITACFRILLRYYDKHYYPGGLAADLRLGWDRQDAEAVAAQLNPSLL